MRARVGMVVVIVACVASPNTAGIASAHSAAAPRIAHGAAKSGGLLASREAAAERHATTRIADVRRCA